MKKVAVLIAVVAMALAMVPMTGAFAGSGPKATGGVKWMGGPGATIPHQASFTAQGDVTDAKGNVLVRGGTAAGTFEYKGKVTCYTQTADGQAFFSGRVTKASGVNDHLEWFVINVDDNGEGRSASPDGIRTVRRASDPECEELESDYRPVDRGNIQVHPE